jgi:hypothetical protein
LRDLQVSNILLILTKIGIENDQKYNLLVYANPNKTKLSVR